MISYFEIAGHIVECSTEDSTSLSSSKFGGIAAERPERGRNSAKAEEATTRADRDSLFTHWLKTITFPSRKMGTDILLHNPWSNPRGFIVKGIGIGIAQIEMHYDYFVHGESQEW